MQVLRLLEPLDAPSAPATSAVRTAAVHEAHSQGVMQASRQHSTPAGAAVEAAPPALDPSASDGACYGDEWLTLPLPSRQMCHATHATHGQDGTAGTPSHQEHAIDTSDWHNSLHDGEGTCSEGDRTAVGGNQRHIHEDHTHDNGCRAIALQLCHTAAEEDRTDAPKRRAAQCEGLGQLVPVWVLHGQQVHRTQGPGPTQQPQPQQQELMCDPDYPVLAQPESRCLGASSQQSSHELHGTGTRSDRASGRDLASAPSTPGGDAVAEDPGEPKAKPRLADTSGPDAEEGGGGAGDGPGQSAAVEVGEAQHQVPGRTRASVAWAQAQLQRSGSGGGGGGGRGSYRVRRCSAPPVDMCLGAEMEYTQASGQTTAVAAALATASASVPGGEGNQRHQSHSPPWGSESVRPPASPLAALRLSPLDACTSARELRFPRSPSVVPSSPAASDAAVAASPRTLARRHTVNFTRVLQPGRHRVGVGHVSHDTGRYAHVDLVGLDEADLEAVQGLVDRGLLLAATMFVQSRRQQQQQQQGGAGAVAGGGRALARSRSDSQRSCMAYGRASVAVGGALLEGGREEG